MESTKRDRDNLRRLIHEFGFGEVEGKTWEDFHQVIYSAS